MKIKSIDLLKELSKTTKELKQIAEEKFIPLSEQEFNYKTNPDSWSVAQCLEHLNLYGDYYLEVMQKAIEKSNSPSQELFKSGMLGNYFANMMLPKEGEIKKMEAQKKQNPSKFETIYLPKETLNRFIGQQEQMLELLEKAKNKSLNKIRIPITLSKLIKLRLGDAFRFNVNHTLRHMNQAQRVIDAFS